MLLALLYADKEDFHNFNGVVSLMGIDHKVKARRIRYWFHPLISLADFILKKVGINYDFVFYRVVVSIPTISFDITFDHWAVPVTKNPLCNSAIYQSYLIRRFFKDKTRIPKFMCPSWASSVQFLIR